MAVEIGAATEDLGLLMMAGPQIPESVLMNIGTHPDVKTVPLMAIVLEPNTLWVNKRGERFIDEAASYNHFLCANAVNRQPGNVCYTLLDYGLVQTMTEKGLIIGMGGEYHIEDQRTRMPGLAGELQIQADKGWVKVSDSWEGIAKWIGASHRVLEATIDEYNTACEQGHDPIFAKERSFLVPLRTAPYYAIRGNSGFLDTVGGLKINEHMEVLDKQDNPIPGLYAAGVVAGGWEADTHCAALSGAPSGFALNSGRMAAENAVNFVMEDTRY
jgi:fumarate reductase flavoprotein subunit